MVLVVGVCGRLCAWLVVGSVCVLVVDCWCVVSGPTMSTLVALWLVCVCVCV